MTDAAGAAVVTDGAEPPPQERIARQRHPLAIRWMHWVNVPLLLVMVWSGLRIYWANDIYRIGFADTTFFAFFPDGVYGAFDLGRHLARGLAFHFTFGWLFAINGIVYGIYLAASGQWRHIVPDRRAIGEVKDAVLHDLHIRRTAPPQGRYNAAQQLAYTTIILMGALIVLTGLAIYKPTQLSLLTGLFGGYETARAIHFWTTIGFVAFTVVHVLQVIRAGWRNFAAMVTGYELDPDEPNRDQPSQDHPDQDQPGEPPVEVPT